MTTPLTLIRVAYSPRSPVPAPASSPPPVAATEPRPAHPGWATRPARWRWWPPRLPCSLPPGVGDGSDQLDVQLSWLLADTAVADALTRLTNGSAEGATQDLGPDLLAAAGAIPTAGGDERAVRGEGLAVLGAARSGLSGCSPPAHFPAPTR